MPQSANIKIKRIDMVKVKALSSSAVMMYRYQSSIQAVALASGNLLR
jgi:hypothetical protein